MNVDRGEGPSGPWTLSELKVEERPLLEGMFQFYLYDFSEMDHDDVDETGRFADEDLELLCNQPDHPGRHALILRINGKPAGFALIEEESSLPDGAGYHHIQEFHVLRAYRSQGYGKAMAVAIFNRFPGAWQVEEIGPNVAAQQFWRRTIEQYTGGRYTKRTVRGRRLYLVIQEFDTRQKGTL